MAASDSRGSNARHKNRLPRHPRYWSRALIAPVALLALEDELRHLAQIRAGLADEVARRKLELPQIVPAEPRGAVRGLVPLPRDQRHPDGAHHSVVRRHRDLLPEQARE